MLINRPSGRIEWISPALVVLVTSARNLIVSEMLTLSSNELPSSASERIESRRCCGDQRTCYNIYCLDVALEIKGCVVVAWVFVNQILQDGDSVGSVQRFFLHEPLGL
jgi:hypothetical protein